MHSSHVSVWSLMLRIMMVCRLYNGQGSGCICSSTHLRGRKLFWTFCKIPLWFLWLSVFSTHWLVTSNTQVIQVTFSHHLHQVSQMTELHCNHFEWASIAVRYILPMIMNGPAKFKCTLFHGLLSHSLPSGEINAPMRKLRCLHASLWALRYHSEPILVWRGFSLMLQMLLCTPLYRSTSVQLWAGDSKCATTWLGQLEIFHNGGANPGKTEVPAHFWGGVPC